MPNGLEVERMRTQFLQQKPGYCFSQRASQHLLALSIGVKIDRRSTL